MKTLNTIQTLAKIGKVLSKIVFIFSLIGVIGCAAGIVSMQLLPENIRLGNVTIQGLVEASAEISKGSLYAAMAAGLVICIGEAVLAKLAERYFQHELRAGTPFTFDGAKELLRLGICAICIPIGTKVVAGIVFQIMAQVLQDVSDLRMDDPVPIGLGVMMIIASLLCKYGTELTQGASSIPGETEA